MKRLVFLLLLLVGLASFATPTAAQVNDGSNWACGNNPAWNCTVDVFYEGENLSLIVQNVNGASAPVPATEHTTSSHDAPAAASSGVARCPDGKQYKAANGWLFRKINGRWWPMGKLGNGKDLLPNQGQQEPLLPGNEVTSLPTLVGVPADWQDWH